MVDSPLPFKLTATAARRIIKEIAEDSSRVILTTHAKQRMRKRKISLAQVLNCLKSGQVDEGPASNMYGDWQCTMRWKNAGDFVRVAVAIEHDPDTHKRLIVITVMYES